MKAIKILGGVAIFGLTVMLVSMAHAGAGAQVYACIHLPDEPSSPLTVKVKVGDSGTQCMNAVGENTTLIVSTAGVTCSSVGYVEAKPCSKKSDLNATDTSTWSLSYSIQNTAYSGSTQTSWHSSGIVNFIKLSDASEGTIVCGAQALCDSTSYQWKAGTLGPLYIILQPLAQ